MRKSDHNFTQSSRTDSYDTPPPQISNGISPVKQRGLNSNQQLDSSPLSFLNPKQTSQNISRQNSMKKSLKFTMKIQGDSKQEFEAEHDPRSTLSQLYNDISQLKNIKASSIILSNKGNNLPCDSTPLNYLIREGDIITASFTNENGMNSSQKFITMSNSQQMNKSQVSTLSTRNQSPSTESKRKMGTLDCDSRNNLDSEVYPTKAGQQSYGSTVMHSSTYLHDSQTAINPNIVSCDPAELDQELEISVNSVFPYVQLSSEQQTIPVLISLNTKRNFDPKVYHRPPIDLVCVLDNSGSMHGDKLNMLKETIEYLIDQLNDKDRLGIVLFNSGVQSIPMKSMDDKNKLSLKQQISEIRAYGGTDINLGMTEAFKFIKNRKYSNPVTSLFLLSDGLDSFAQDRVSNTLKQMALNEPFSVNCFGFGRDHDPMLMNSISKLQDGSFYFIDKIEQVDMYFVDALGGLFSVMGQDVLIKIRTVNEGAIISRISQTYGDMWCQLSDRNTNGGWEYCIKMSHLLHGVSKDFLCEVIIDSNRQSQSFQAQEMDIIEVEVDVYTIATVPQKLKKQVALKLAVYGKNQPIPKNLANQVNREVQLNFLRVKGAKALQDCILEGQQKRYKQGQQLLMERLEDIEKAQLGGQAELLMLRNDLLESRDALQPGFFEKEGLHRIIANQRTHMEQRSKANNLENDCYQNSLQKEMVKRRLREKYGIEEEEEEEVKEESIEVQDDKIDLYKVFCQAASQANTLYIIQQEIPNFEEFFRDQLEQKMLYEGSQSIIANSKISEILSKNKLQVLLSSLNNQKSEIQQVRQEAAEQLTSSIQEEVGQTLIEAGIDLKEIFNGDLNVVTDFLLENEIEDLGQMPQLSEELSKKQLKQVHSTLIKFGTAEKILKLIKAKGGAVKGKKASKQAEKDRQLVEDVLEVAKKAVQSQSDCKFSEIEALIRDIMSLESDTRTQSKMELDTLLEKEIGKIQKNVLNNLQTGLFGAMVLKNLKEYFTQLDQSQRILQ